MLLNDASFFFITAYNEGKICNRNIIPKSVVDKNREIKIQGNKFIKIEDLFKFQLLVS